MKWFFSRSIDSTDFRIGDTVNFCSCKNKFHNCEYMNLLLIFIRTMW